MNPRLLFEYQILRVRKGGKHIQIFKNLNNSVQALHVALSARYRVDRRGWTRIFLSSYSQNLLLIILHNWVYFYKNGSLHENCYQHLKMWVEQAPNQEDNPNANQRRGQVTTTRQRDVTRSDSKYAFKSPTSLIGMLTTSVCHQISLS